MDRLQKKEKEITQAIVIADNFNDNFAPITNEMPVVCTCKCNAIIFKLNSKRSQYLYFLIFIRKFIIFN